MERQDINSSISQSSSLPGREPLFALPVRVCSSALLILLFVLQGCVGGGGGGSSSAGPPQSKAEVQRVTVSQAPDSDRSFLVVYELEEITEPVRLTFEYSEDLGATFQPCSALEGTFELQVGENTGQVVWEAEADLGTTPQSDIMIRVTPQGIESGIIGNAAVSGAFCYLSTSPPEITSCTVPESPSGKSVKIQFTGSDQQGDTVTFSASYSLDSGNTFRSLDITSPAENTTTLSPEGTTTTFYWNAGEALTQDRISGVLIKVSAWDATGSSEKVSNPFDLILCSPSISGITIEEIPLSMNGTEPFTNLNEELEEYSLLVPHTGFSIRVTFQPHENGASIAPESLFFTVSSEIGPSGEIQSGTDIGSLFSADANQAVLTIDNGTRFPSGPVSVTARISDQLGNRSAAYSYEMVVESSGQARYPFAYDDCWALTFSRDNWSIDSEYDDGVSPVTITVTKEFTANGVADFIEDLELLGLYTTDEPELGNRVASMVKQYVLSHLRTRYGIEEDGSRTTHSSQIAFSLSQSTATSNIAFGGADPSGGYTLGRAYYDRCNTRRESNISSNLGIFSTNLIHFYINSSYTFKALFDPFIPGRGTPVGQAEEDQTVLSDSFTQGDPANTLEEESRYRQIIDAARGLGKALGAIAGHEIGHSVGLVANGPPPEGLFGGEENAAFTYYYTNPYHIDTPGNNIMEAAISFASTQYTGTNALRFNELNMAYLLERVLLEK